MLSVEVVLRLVLSTGVVVGALLAVRWWSTRAGGRGRGAIKVVARTGLSRSTAVAVIDVGRHRYLVGSGEHSVNLLAELDPDEDLGQAVAVAGVPVAGGPTADSGEEFDPIVRAEGSALDRSMRDRPWNGPLAHLRRWTTRVPREVRIHGVDQ